MRKTHLIMGMPITVEVVDAFVRENDIEEIFTYFRQIDERFSTYKKESEISQINRGELSERDYSADMQMILLLSEQTKKETNGYFNIQRKDGTIDPSGIVKGWAIQQAAKKLWKRGFQNFYIDAGGDIQVSGKNNQGNLWRVGIKNPFNQEEISKVVMLTDQGIATSGSYIRGQHVYNPLRFGRKLEEIVSMTVIGPNVYEADRFATAAFAMQEKGIGFIASLKGFAGYMIDRGGVATYTANFSTYEAH